MNIQLNNDFCSNTCKSLETCNKYCALHAGRALENFINNVDTTESRIGEFDRSNFRDPNSKLDLVVSGHQIWDLKQVSWSLTDISTTLDATPKFKSVCNMSPVKLLEGYCKYIEMSKEDTKETLSKLQKINKNKLLILPFKPHTVCKIDIDSPKVKEKNKQGEIAFIKWRTCLETFKLICTIGINVEGATSKQIYKYDITEYLDKFRLSNLDIKASGNKGDDKLIRITNYGIIKPIVVKEGNVSIAIDNTYLYMTVNGDTTIIGHWNSNDELIMNKEIDNKAIKKIKTNLDKIRVHRKYIGPYLMFEANEIMLKESKKGK